MDDATKTMALTLAAGVVKKGLVVLGTSFATHGIINSNQIETFVSIGVAAVPLIWSFWNDYGKAILISQLEVLKAKSLAQAAKIQNAGLRPVSVNEIAAQSPTLTAASVAKTVATLPPAIQATVSKVAMIVLALSSLFLLSVPGDAMAQAIKKQSNGLPCDPANLLPGCKPVTTAVGEVAGLDPQALIKKIMTLAGPDLIYAAALAKNANTSSSLVRLQCLTAIQTLNSQVQGTGLKDAQGNVLTQPAEPDVFTNLEQIAEGIDALSPTGPLFTSCAGAAALAGMNVIAFINAAVAGTAAAAIVIPK